ncbi:MAG: FAD-dependent oxidoreductase [Patescibacteria group bacterium]
MLKNDLKIHDLLIIGAGPAGLTASIYASRYKLSNAIVGDVLGGLAAEAHKVSNYPSEDEIRGFELMGKMRQKAIGLGAELVFGKVIKLEKDGEFFVANLEDGQQVAGKKLLLATGSNRQRLEINNEKKFLGKGISYCSTCDGMFAKDKIAMVVGGGNSAVTAGIYLAEVAQKVFLVYRGQELKAEPMWIDEINKLEKVEIIYQASIKELIGEEKLEKVILDNDQEIEVNNLFVEIGSSPANELAQSLGVELDKKGYIKIDSAQATNIKNVWAAGDITTGSNGFKQIITACAEGAVAGESVFKAGIK